MECHSGCFSVFFVQPQSFLQSIDDCLSTCMYAEMLECFLEICAFAATFRRDLDNPTPTQPASSSCWMTEWYDSSSDPICVRKRYRSLYLAFNLSCFLLDNKVATPPIRNNVLAKSIDLMLPS